VTVAPPEPGSHGGDGARLAAALGMLPGDVLDLSASLNPVAPDPVPVVRRHLEALRRYPDESRALAALAEAVGVDGRLLVLTNGGAEAIALVAAEMRTGWADEPEFSLYRRHIRLFHPDGPRWRSNPHNPTGLLAGPGERAGVWDEAFWPLATGTWTRGDAAKGSIVVGSLTKLFACPGLRAGYVLCPDDSTAARLRALRPEWSFNGLAAEALPELLGQTDLPLWAKLAAGLRRDLVGVLSEAGLEPRPSDANWVLVDVPGTAAGLAGDAPGTAAGLRAHLARQAILVRDCTSFGMPGTVRIAVPDAHGLQRLAAALRTRGLTP
jgi:histidinol-phosphate/aromatic aminotransferase/cobyric acid decarboxylase-like protein